MLNPVFRILIFSVPPEKNARRSTGNISTGRVLKILEKWKGNDYKLDTVGKVESAGKIVEKPVESVNTRSISPAFPHSGSGISQKPCKYAPGFQLFIQHLLKTKKTEHTLPVIFL